MTLSQSKYAEEILERAYMYRRLADALQYLTFTRSDISYVGQQLHVSPTSSLHTPMLIRQVAQSLVDPVVMTSTVVNKSVSRAFFKKQKLTGPNFINWYYNLRIMMSVEDKLTYLEHPIPVVLVPTLGQQLPPDVLATHTTWVKASKRYQRKMLHLRFMQIRAGMIQKNIHKNKKPQLAARGNNQWKGKTRLAYAPKPKIPLHQRRTILLKTRSPTTAMARKPYSHQVERAKDLLGLIHTDVCGPFRTVSRQGDSYFVTFTDDFSRYRCVYLLKHKHEVFETFKVFQKEVEIQLGKTIKSLHSDRGGEYMSQEFLDHLKEHDIIAHLTHPYTPQHNGVSERRNKTMLDMVRFMMSQTTLSKSFWDYAVESVARILNIVPTKKVEKTPYEVWHRKAPKMSYLRVWVVLVARNVEFFENSIITQEASGSLEDLKIIQDEDTHPSENTSLHHDEVDQEIDEPQSDINPIRRSTKTRHAPARMCLYVDAEENELGDLNEFANYKAALLDTEYDKWLVVMNVKMQSMKDNQVWDLVDLPLNGKIVGSKWLFKRRLIWMEIFHMENSKRGSIPMKDKPKLCKSQGASTPVEVKLMQRFPYAPVVGSIMVACYTDAGYMTDVDDCKSQTGYKSTKHRIFTTSSAKVEYIAASDVAEEAVWIRKLIYGLGVVPTNEEPKEMYCDDTGAITIANEPGIAKDARHYHAKVHFLREVIEFGDIVLEKVYTYDNVADPFTNALPFN
uniref:Retrotransposon protein, putative, Ty1-copia subclass n=1 Tax=Tanacetum cinerariifolium TaxID=118510 RepID=A0A699GZ94_TANCI|nr:retrotransposon protein, putative, Ty1-copia subclass [Tanacetum cinerariifolium]